MVAFDINAVIRFAYGRTELYPRFHRMGRGVLEKKRFLVFICFLPCWKVFSNILILLEYLVFISFEGVFGKRLFHSVDFFTKLPWRYRGMKGNEL